MYSFIVLLVPSVLGIKILDKLCNLKLKKDLIIDYLLLVLFSNLISAILIIALNNFDGNLCIYIDHHLIFACKYIILSLFINIILSFIFSICIVNLDISLEVQNGKKNKKNN